MCVAQRDWALLSADMIGHESAIEWLVPMATIGAGPLIGTIARRARASAAREARPIEMLRDEQGRSVLISRSAAARRDAGGANLSCIQILLVPLERNL